MEILNCKRIVNMRERTQRIIEGLLVGKERWLQNKTAAREDRLRPRTVNILRQPNS
jgi:hypothetical protein